MKEIVFTVKKDIDVPVELDSLLPVKLQEMSVEEIKKIELPQGNKKISVEELFNVNVNENEAITTPKVTINDSSMKLKRIGEKMEAGEIVVNGDAGMYVGAEMKSGKITVNGNAECWVAQNLKGGEVIINGDAKDYVGSAYRGDWRGMSGGKITINGNAGTEIGEYMKKGLIVVNGNCKIMPGVHQNGGIIIINGEVEGRAGGEMLKGAIVINGPLKSKLPSFEYEGIVEDPVIKLTKKDEGTPIKGTYYKYIGDFVSNKPKGQLYLSVEHNDLTC
ncbi:tungsten-dependent formylmethanofuran dehydrogenase subunit FwdC [Methanococcus voltae]|uniref:Tungsten-containing formylmethanofuran dehydrogenase 2 subunit C n=2 Tax=Methanococcus voltae TaxID=2188 RepID=A0A8J7S428_METVO|nr:tungsten-dependent formylmethanofuran dehydrogenase subunit FwdC [Methanococcus voltae]MBP2171940.1 formylmethanofuran dehydrogenase subunit C [Methanococcus voltae]MBP2201105.1 formylmethanofuran dehydrogenase subunit C [Methanococcus voltae]MCS3921828.1 formylmethanofuran dehydrogenase subunit C [Methanococcus voltae PS]